MNENRHNRFGLKANPLRTHIGIGLWVGSCGKVGLDFVVGVVVRVGFL